MISSKRDIFYKALFDKDNTFEGIFIVGVKTTGIFCRPTCPAKPKIQNVEFYNSTQDAINAGFRACKVCKPMEQSQKTYAEISCLLQYMENNPSVEIDDTIIAELGVDIGQVKRWTLENYNLQFNDFQKLYRTENVFQSSQAEKAGAKEFDSEYLMGLNNKYKKIFDNTDKVIHIAFIESEVGTIVTGATDKGVCLLEFADSKKLERELVQLITLFKSPLVESGSIHLDSLHEQLKQYFRGELQEFNIPLDLKGTDFQVQAWLGLQSIPYGSTTTYAKQAEAMGKPSAIRAVANANGKNRISIVLPCHRVIGTDGSLTGYGGGIWRKKKLLELERNAKR